MDTNLAALAVVVGGVGLVSNFYTSNPYTRILPALIVGGGIVGAVAIRSDESYRELAPVSLSNNLILLVYVLTVELTVLAYVLGDFRRSLLVHVLLVAMYVVTAAGIVVLDSGASKLPLIVTSGVVHRSLVYYASELQMGMDTQGHTETAAAISRTVSLDPLAQSKYWYAPLYHVWTAFVKGLFGIPVRDAAFLAVGLGSVIVPTVAIYVYLTRYWSPTVASFGALLFLTGDYVIAKSVLVTPTTVAIVLFSVLLVTVDPYLRSGRYTALAGFVLGLVLLVFTHQLGLFIAVVCLGTYVAAQSFWDGDVGGRELLVFSLLGAAIAFQMSITRLNGPEGDAGLIITEMLPVMIDSLRSFGRASATVPSDTPFLAVSGADALSAVQVLGTGLLFFFAVVGAIRWIGLAERGSQRSAVGLSAMVTSMSFFVFAGPLIGFSFFIPRRWLPFLYLPLAALGALGVAVILGTMTRRRGSAALVIALLLVTAPYVTLMTLNYQGSLDDPAFDDASEAQRYMTTETERSLYRFVGQYGDDSLVVSDHVAWPILEHKHGQRAVVFRHRHGTPGSVHEGDRLIVDREYGRTDRASYMFEYDGGVERVFGPLPINRTGTSRIFTNGDDHVLYRNGSS